MKFIKKIEHKMYIIYNYKTNRVVGFSPISTAARSTIKMRHGKRDAREISIRFGGNVTRTPTQLKFLLDR